MMNGRFTILLVEDDENDVFLIRRAFAKAQIHNPLQVVEDGEKAVAYLLGAPPYDDRHAYPIPMLVLLDLKLPRLSGIEVLERLRGQPGLRRIPVVVLTSSRESSDINRAYDLGANSYLVKPVDFEGLLEMVRNLNFYWLPLNVPPDIEENNEGEAGYQIP